MIRLKHNIYPVWLTWEGDRETFAKVKEFVIEDIKLSGLGHYEAFEDIDDDETTAERQGNDWVNKADKPVGEDVVTKPQADTIKEKDGTELSYGAIPTEADEVEADNSISETGQVPNKTGKVTRQAEGGFKKFADK